MDPHIIDRLHVVILRILCWIHYICCIVRFPEVFIVVLETDDNSGIQILAPWRTCLLRGMGSSGVPLSNLFQVQLFALLIIIYYCISVYVLLFLQATDLFLCEASLLLGTRIISVYFLVCPSMLRLNTYQGEDLCLLLSIPSALFVSIPYFDWCTLFGYNHERVFVLFYNLLDDIMQYWDGCFFLFDLGVLS
ncbi:hypothetical protein PIB30_026722 [Stylosanthes scabra]|uniref:Transmembrane protein n=1 Tax=Stylosanthes scabra TaxID=79078 RepID=A0ABU6TA98_9FABA|nr:hypothetical protein [Stylosanthes scabra]